MDKILYLSAYPSVLSAAAALKLHADAKGVPFLLGFRDACPVADFPQKGLTGELDSDILSATN
ncbi:MAG: hypothetical protein ACLTU3_15045 [Acutalibacteraceae bacterium]